MCTERRSTRVGRSHACAPGGVLCVEEGRIHLEAADQQGRAAPRAPEIPPLEGSPVDSSGAGHAAAPTTTTAGGCADASKNTPKGGTDPGAATAAAVAAAAECGCTKGEGLAPEAGRARDIVAVLAGGRAPGNCPGRTFQRARTARVQRARATPARAPRWPARRVRAPHEPRRLLRPRRATVAAPLADARTLSGCRPRAAALARRRLRLGRLRRLRDADGGGGGTRQLWRGGSVTRDAAQRRRAARAATAADRWRYAQRVDGSSRAGWRFPAAPVQARGAISPRRGAVTPQCERRARVRPAAPIAAAPSHAAARAARSLTPCLRAFPHAGANFPPRSWEQLYEGKRSVVWRAEDVLAGQQWVIKAYVKRLMSPVDLQKARPHLSTLTLQSSAPRRGALPRHPGTR